MLDIEGVTGLIRTALRQLNVDPSHYGIQVKIQNMNHQVIHYLCDFKKRFKQVSLPRHLNHATQAELSRLLFDEFGLQSVNLTHQSVLSLLSYNSTSGIVVDIGERIDIVPIMDGKYTYIHFSCLHMGKPQMDFLDCIFPIFTIRLHVGVGGFPSTLRRPAAGGSPTALPRPATLLTYN